MKRFFAVAPLIFAVTVTLALGGCTKKNKDQEGDTGLNLSETLRVNITTEPPSLDWNKATDTTSAAVVANLMDGLTAYNLEDPELSLRPSLAESWEPSQNATVWTFKLRKGVKWTDGKELTGQHVLDGWERLLNPLTAGEYAYFLFPMKNAKEYNEKKVTDFSQVGVKLVDPYTIQVTLSQPMGFFPYLTTHHSTYPIRKDIIEKFGDKWTHPGNIVTLAAYTLKDWQHDKHLILERNENYYGEKAKTKYVLCRMIKEDTTAISLMDAGKLDVLIQLPSTELEKLGKRPDFKQIGILASYYYGFNTKKAPFDNVNFRKAIIHAVSREEIVNMIKGGQIPLAGWIPKGMFGYENDIGLKFDPAKAKEYLKKAGYTDVKKIPKITLSFNTNGDHSRIAENIQAQIKKNLGIDIEVKNEEWKVYLANMKADTPQMYRMGWVADYPDPDNFFTLMTSTSDNNYTKWKSEKFDKLVSQGGAEVDKAKRKALYVEAQKLLVEEDAPVLPIYTSVAHYLIAPRIKNFPINPLTDYHYGKVEIVREGLASK